MARRRRGLPTPGRRWVGDGTRRAWATRAHGVGHHAFSWSPLPGTGATAEALAAWSAEGMTPPEAGELARIVRRTDRGQEGRAAAGEACARPGWAQGGAAAWRERGGWGDRRGLPPDRGRVEQPVWPMRSNHALPWRLRAVE